MLSKFAIAFLYFYFGINLGLKVFGNPAAPILTITNNELQLNIANSIVTGVVSIVLALVGMFTPVIIMYFKKKWKVKDED